MNTIINQVLNALKDYEGGDFIVNDELLEFIENLSIDNTTRWFEVYEDNEDFTLTVAQFDTLKEAEAYVEGKSGLKIDQWEMGKGEIPNRVI